VKIFSDIFYPIIKPAEPFVNEVIKCIEEKLDDANNIIPKQKRRRKNHKTLKTHKNINTNKLKRKKSKK
ncbi:MAG: hypothetical protein KKA79_02055, partial [Nanoarchaeota archaeon]|nr:hypothetical protein [Nanoarchaeota archaeon]